MESFGHIGGQSTYKMLQLLFGCSILSMFILVEPSATAQTYAFGQAKFPLPSYAGAMVARDFNGDGILDFAVTIPDPRVSQLAILMGNKDGTFQPAVTYGTFGIGTAIAAGDLNRDGKVDLATVAGGVISVLLGNGDGTFQSGTNVAVSGYPVSIKMADFNGDGKLDLVLTDSDDDAVSILLGNGNGTFQPQRKFSTDTSPNQLVVRDFNGDGKQDLALLSGGKVTVLLGNGDGSFQPFVEYDAGPTPTSMTVGDFNNDGRSDLAVLSGNVVSLLFGNGNGTFQPHADFKIGTLLGTPYQIIAADFNGDSKLDLAIATTKECYEGCSTSVLVLLGKGDGTFPTRNEYAAYTGDMTTGDFNGDGKLDLAIADRHGTLTVLLGRGNGTFQHSISYAAGASYGVGTIPKAIATADLRGIGTLDLVVANSATNTVSILQGNGNGTFKAHVDYATGASPRSLAVGDLNSDGKVDIAVANSGSNTISILLGNGDGTFQARFDLPTGIAPSSVITADLNKDGKLDLVVTNSGSNTLSIFLGNGNGSFQPRADYATGAGPSAVTANEFVNFGTLDLFVANYNSGTVSLLRGNGDGTFQPRSDYPVRSGPISLASGQFGFKKGVISENLGIVSQRAQALSVLSIWNVRNDYSAGPLPVALISGDFNVDGAPDLVVANSGNNTITVNIACFVPPYGFWSVRDHYFSFITGSSSAVTSGDFDGNGSLDLAVAGSRGVSILLNDPATALFPNKLNFGNQPVAAMSGTNTVLLSNSTSAPLNISSIGIVGADAGDYLQTNNCVPQVLPGANCTISVTFTPKSTGTRVASVVVMDNLTGPRPMIRVTGVGTSQ